ncbi:tail fiber assembly protein [Aeromonas veronii]|uniref:tail fiber assembly protein n=1 Tax=Aeromonas veronii TaxID=654 RepID=UPI00236489E5|nr:tail fiber assembly protein [Aeromonas veronii]MDD1846569.1 tail fiber assembly protein [Aeromonas veronii]
MVKFDENGFALTSGEVICHCCYPDGAYIGAMPVYVSIATGLPAHAYLDAPPEHNDGEWPSRADRDKEWSILPDLRGQTAYHIDTKEAREITELGPLRERETLLQPSSPYDAWDGFHWVADHEAEAAAALAAASARRSALLAEANQYIAVLSDAVDLGMATADEQAAYNAWRRYRIELTRLDLTVTPIAWPEKPA